MTTTLPTEPTRLLRDTADARTHRFIGDPMHGPCLCRKPFASPIHHDQAPWSRT